MGRKRNKIFENLVKADMDESYEGIFRKVHRNLFSKHDNNLFCAAKVKHGVRCMGLDKGIQCCSCKNYCGTKT